ncbi:MAG: DUF2461 domain-containing protein [Saprospiraceae bacterium]|nr:DUF2461 domain-containing protein [Saprospiraceae bacterium]
MKYFSKDFIQFFKDLSANNNRDWFKENKARFDNSVQDPFNAFVQDMLHKMTKNNPALEHIQAKDCIFRIYRDTRFSKDKTPYKTHMSALIGPGGRKDKTHPGMYIQLSAEDARLYSGAHMLDKDQLQAIRMAISRDLKGFSKAIGGKKFKDTFGEIQGEKNKRLNPPFAELAEKQPLLFNKSFYYYKKWPANQTLKDSFAKDLTDAYKAAKPVNDFLFRALA